MSLPVLAIASATAFAIIHLSAIQLSITSIALLAVSIWIPLIAFWSFFLRPVYFSNLLALKLPELPRKGFLKRYNPNEILDWSDTIPNDGFVRYLDTFNFEVICLTDPRWVAEMLGPKADSIMKRHKPKKFLENIVGNGLLVAEDKDHKYQRKHLLPAFNHKVIKNLYPVFWSKASEMTTLIKENIRSASPTNSSAVIDVDNWAARVSLDIIGKAGFGSDFHSLSQPEDTLNTLYRDAFVPNKFTPIFFVLSLLTHPTLIIHLPFDQSRRTRRGVKAVTVWIKDFLAKRQDASSEKSDNGGSRLIHQDIISAAMESRAFNIENLVDQSKTLLGAGHETSATALTWGLYLLSQPRYAKIQERLREEVCQNLPSPHSGVEVTEDMLDKLPYLDAVSKEILRVHAPVPAIGRVSKTDVEIGGKMFPKGTNFFYLPWVINKSKKFWGEDAREFRPERWLEDKVNGGATESSAMLTFGIGTRNCIGRGFAIAENKALLAQLVGCFDIKPQHGEPDELNIAWGITARMIGGLHLKTTILEGW